MKIKKLFIKNFRILSDFQIDLEDEISLIIGKNNSGKTSILTILDKFLNQSDKNSFSIEDFNLAFKKQLQILIEDAKELSEEEYLKYYNGISLRILILYNNNDSFINVQKLMLDLDPANNYIVLGFDYYLSFKNYLGIRKDLAQYRHRETVKKAEAEGCEPPKKYNVKGFSEFFKLHYQKYFQTRKKSIFYDKTSQKIVEDNYILIEDLKISDLISFKYISATRDVTNKETDKTLSLQTSKIYERKENDENEAKKIDDFYDTIINTDEELSKIYETFFEDIIVKIKNLGGIRENESILSVLSTLQSKELLKGNTTVYYKHELSDLPEQYNGLGYLNLISMIFEIEIKKYEFQRSSSEVPSDINLLFIEEPEAHTHPQMQYVFIKNIRTIVEDKISKKIKNIDNIEFEICRSLQTIISTHSSHIVADSDFDEIKYLKKTDTISSKNLKDLKKLYDDTGKQYQFLKQYLTISRAEIFFADKAILIEGDTERILLPTIMKKIDINLSQYDKENKKIPLLSQNVSIIEVGAYSEVFELFIDFIGVKTLIVTDLDSTHKVKKLNKNDIEITKGEACRVAIGDNYANPALKFFLNNKTLEELKSLTLKDKCLVKTADKWIQNENGTVCITYQTNYAGYTARSFEESFLVIPQNKNLVISNIESFKGVKNPRHFVDENKDSYDLANECINKKTHFALDILYHSNDDYSNWEIPEYIKEGLLWLKEN